MLAAHAAPDTQELYTISANGFSATADGFARDPDSEGLWFLSMVGAQSALKAIWAALLKHPPESAQLLADGGGTVLSGGFHGCAVPDETVGTWTTKIARLPLSQGWHAFVYTRLAEYAFERDAFLLLAQCERYHALGLPCIACLDFGEICALDGDPVEELQRGECSHCGRVDLLFELRADTAAESGEGCIVDGARCCPLCSGGQAVARDASE